MYPTLSDRSYLCRNTTQCETSKQSKLYEFLTGVREVTVLISVITPTTLPVGFGAFSQAKVKSVPHTGHTAASFQTINP